MVIDQALEAEAAQFTTLERPCQLPASLLAQLGRSFWQPFTALRSTTRRPLPSKSLTLAHDL